MQTKLIDFHGVQIEACEHSGTPYANLKRMCECLRLGYASQRQKLQDKRWAGMTIIVTPDGRGRPQPMAFLSADSVPMWLAGLSEKKVAEHVRPLLAAFQDECRDVLFEHFQNDSGVSINSRDLASIHSTLEQHQTQLIDIVSELARLNDRCQRNQEMMAELMAELVPAVRRIDDRTKGQREEIRKEDKNRIVACVWKKYAGLCPCCQDTQIVSNGRKISDVQEFDHFHHRSMAAIEYVWLVCKSCNRKLKNRKPDGYWMRKTAAFHSFQDLLQSGIRRQMSLFDG